MSETLKKLAEMKAKREAAAAEETRKAEEAAKKASEKAAKKATAKEQGGESNSPRSGPRKMIPLDENNPLLLEMRDIKHNNEEIRIYLLKMDESQKTQEEKIREIAIDLKAEIIKELQNQIKQLERPIQDPLKTGKELEEVMAIFFLEKSKKAKLGVDWAAFTEHFSAHMVKSHLRFDVSEFQAIWQRWQREKLIVLKTKQKGRWRAESKLEEYLQNELQTK